jgi:ketosteroid isomerase-like protein
MGADSMIPTRTAEEQIHELNDAVGSNDLRRFTEGMHPDAVWEHNHGSGSPEEGEYKGRKRIERLFERILEGWEYLRPAPTDIHEVEPGVFLVHGELRCKHSASDNVIVAPYEQRLEIRDGQLVRARMVIGSTAGG